MIMDFKAFFQLSYGVYLLGTAYENQDYGCIINTACQVTATPAQISVAVNKENCTCEMIQKSGHFSVNVLTQDAHMEFIGRYGFKSGREIDKFAGMDVTHSAAGDPMLLDSAEVGAAFSCKVVSSLDVGTHILFVGLVEEAVVTGYGKPLTYADYHLVKKGVTPPKASSFQPEAPKKESDQPQWRCTVCGYVHTGNQPPEKCPICKQGPEKFEKI
ncbi:MAG: flavin reductase [Clostridiales bacterium]|nr:flavin reductase [Clostridiales bacterium]